MDKEPKQRVCIISKWEGKGWKKTSHGILRSHQHSSIHNIHSTIKHLVSLTKRLTCAVLVNCYIMRCFCTNTVSLTLVSRSHVMTMRTLILSRLSWRDNKEGQSPKQRGVTVTNKTTTLTL